jgi:hypothetical protein
MAQPNSITITFDVDGKVTTLELTKPAIGVFEEQRLSQRQPSNSDVELGAPLDADIGAMLKRMMLDTCAQLMIRPMLLSKNGG